MSQRVAIVTGASSVSILRYSPPAMAARHKAGTLMETEVVDAYKTSWIPDTAETWEHRDLATSTLWTGWIGGQRPWEKDYKPRPRA
jgi:hypothetical protein